MFIHLKTNLKFKWFLLILEIQEFFTFCRKQIVKHICKCISSASIAHHVVEIFCVISAWWPKGKNSPNICYACCKGRLNSAHLSGRLPWPCGLYQGTGPFRLGVGHGAYYPTLEKPSCYENERIKSRTYFSETDWEMF